MTIEENGVFVPAAKNANMLTNAADETSTNKNRPYIWKMEITAAPKRPPITKEGPKKLRPVPELTVIAVANIFTRRTAIIIQIGNSSIFPKIAA